MIFVHPHPRFNVYREFMAPPVSSPSRVVRGSGNQDDDFPDFDVPAGKYPKKATMESEASVQLGFHDFSDKWRWFWVCFWVGLGLNLMYFL